MEGGSGAGPVELWLSEGAVILRLVDTHRTPRRNHRCPDSHCGNLNDVPGVSLGGEFHADG